MAFRFSSYSIGFIILPAHVIAAPILSDVEFNTTDTVIVVIGSTTQVNNFALEFGLLEGIGVSDYVQVSGKLFPIA